MQPYYFLPNRNPKRGTDREIDVWARSAASGVLTKRPADLRYEIIDWDDLAYTLNTAAGNTKSCAVLGGGGTTTMTATSGRLGVQVLSTSTSSTGFAYILQGDATNRAAFTPFAGCNFVWYFKTPDLLSDGSQRYNFMAAIANSGGSERVRINYIDTASAYWQFIINTGGSTFTVTSNLLYTAATNYRARLECVQQNWFRGWLRDSVSGLEQYVGEVFLATSITAGMCGTCGLEKSVGSTSPTGSYIEGWEIYGAVSR